jgi:hypothetical protein
VGRKGLIMAMTLITDNSSDTTDLSSVDFTSGIDSTYKLYIFSFYDINPATDGADFTFQVNASSQSGFNEQMSTTYYYMYHNESDSTAAWAMDPNQDQIGTSYQIIGEGIGNGADESAAGYLYLFNPSDTTYIKHWWSRINAYKSNDYSINVWVDGYFDVTAAIDEVSFKMSTGNFDGTVKMYGVS